MASKTTTEMTAGMSRRRRCTRWRDSGSRRRLQRDVILFQQQDTSDFVSPQVRSCDDENAILTISDVTTDENTRLRQTRTDFNDDDPRLRYQTSKRLTIANLWRNNNEDTTTRLQNDLKTKFILRDEWTRQSLLHEQGELKNKRIVNVQRPQP